MKRISTIGTVIAVILAAGTPVYGDAVVPSTGYLTAVFNDWTNSVDSTAPDSFQAVDTISLNQRPSGDSSLLSSQVLDQLAREESLVYSSDETEDSFTQYGMGALFPDMNRRDVPMALVPLYGNPGVLRSAPNATQYENLRGTLDDGYQYDLRFAVRSQSEPMESAGLAGGSAFPDVLFQAPAPANDTIVPEPATLALVGFALLGWVSNKLRHRLIRT